MSFLDHWRRQDYNALRAMRSTDERPSNTRFSWGWSRNSVLFLSRKWHLAGSEVYARRWGEDLRRRDFDVTFTTPKMALGWTDEHLWSYGAIVCVHGASAEIASRLFHCGVYGPRIIGMVNTTNSSSDPVRLADLVVANTNAEIHENFAIGRVVVLHPPLGDFAVTVGDVAAPGLSFASYVTQVNLDRRHKNPKIFAALAAAFPDQQFLAVLGAYGTQDVPERPNVHVLSNGPRSVQQALAHTRVLLQPSTLESYGMSIAEAVSVGVPVICSDLPGPREAAGNAAIFVGDLDDVGAWSRALQLALTYHSRMVGDCQERAVGLRQREARELESACRALTAVIATRKG